MTTNLRERKRELLRSSIEKAAVELVLEHGYDNVTVDMICAASLASQRTFFNYFGSKEAALLGPTPPPPLPEATEHFVHHPQGDVLADLVRMMAATFDRHGDVDVAFLAQRREVIRENPHLIKAQAERMAAKETELVDLVVRRLRVQGVDPAAEEAQARLIVSLWWGLVRHALRRLLDEPTASFRQVADDLITLLDQIKDH